MHVGTSDLESGKDLIIAELDTTRGPLPPSTKYSGRDFRFTAMASLPSALCHFIMFLSDSSNNRILSLAQPLLRKVVPS